MSTNSNYYGDAPKFGIGIVEDINDPLQAGRVRVRILGLHTQDLNKLPTDDLPWSQIMIPATNAGISGLGLAPVGIEVGAQVFGSFLDGDSKQQFLVQGTMPGISRKTRIQNDQLISNNIDDTPKIIGDSNAEKAFNFFTIAGYGEDQASGIVANLAFETGDDLDTTKTGGLVGWKDDRLSSFKEYASFNNKPSTDLNTQLEYVLFELQTTYVNVNNDLINTKTAKKSAEIFADGYLNDSSTLTTRKSKADQVKAAYGSGDGDTGNFKLPTAIGTLFDKGSIINSPEQLLQLFLSATRQITECVVHFTDTYENQSGKTNVKTIEARHKARGFSEIGYHFLILSNGGIQIGRNINLPELGDVTSYSEINATSTSSDGIQFIKDKEGLELTAYLDGIGYGIGYGHNTIGPPTINLGDTITTEQANSILNNDLKIVESGLLSVLNNTQINQNQFDAYISLIYNIGIGAFTSSTTLKEFKNGNFQKAADAILLFNKSNGVVVQGLTNRRKAERQLFLKPVDSNFKMDKPHNNFSVGISFVGGRIGSSHNGFQGYSSNTFTDEQWKAFDEFILNFKKVWPDSNFLGHSDIDSNKKDPAFDVQSYVKEKFGLANRDDFKTNPIDPTTQTVITSPSNDASIVTEPSTTTPIVLTTPQTDDQVSIVDQSGTSTVSNAALLGTILDLTLYVTQTSLTEQLVGVGGGGGGATILNDLTDVTNSSPTTGNVLRYNGSVFVNTTLGYSDLSGTPTIPTLTSDLTNDSGFVTASSTDTFTNKSGNISQWTNDSGYITTTLSTEQVQDIAGPLVATGGTKTLITVTYQDTTNDMDFVVDSDLANYSNTNSNFVTTIGTPANNQIGIWTGDGTLEGDADLVFDGTNLGVGVSTPLELLQVGDGGVGNYSLFKTSTATADSGGVFVTNNTNTTTNYTSLKITSTFNNGTGARARIGFVKNSAQETFINSGAGLEFQYDGDVILAQGTGNVGIGTLSPATRLHVKSPNSATAETVVSIGNNTIGTGLQILTSDGNLVWGFNAVNSRNLVFQTNQTERMRITSVGKVGIGTTTPNDLLEIKQGIATCYSLSGTTNSAHTNTGFKVYADSSSRYAAIHPYRGAFSSRVGLSFYTSRGTTPSEGMRLEFGLVVGAPTGGDNGTGSINAQSVYDDNVLLTCYVLEAWLDGTVDVAKWDSFVNDETIKTPILDSNGDPVLDSSGNEEFTETLVSTKQHDRARLFANVAQDRLNVDSLMTYVKNKRHMPAFPNPDEWVASGKSMPTGSIIQRLWETVELNMVMLFQARERELKLTNQLQTFKTKTNNKINNLESRLAALEIKPVSTKRI